MGDIVSRLEASATVRETPCGAGVMVWRTWGNESGRQPPVVLFHGGSGSWTHWVRNIGPLVAAGRQVIAPDLPGFGESALPPAGGDADALITPLADGLRALRGGAPCDLVGFSFGGMTAGMLLAEHPAMARRLVLVGAPAMGVTPDRQFELRAWRHLTSEAERKNVHRYNLAALMLRDTALIDGLALELHIANLTHDRMPRRRLAHTDILARSLARVNCPVRAIYGAHDALYKSWISQLADAYAAAAPDFRGLTLVPDSGHWVQFERPEAFDDALLAALAP